MPELGRAALLVTLGLSLYASSRFRCVPRTSAARALRTERARRVLRDDGRRRRRAPRSTPAQRLLVHVRRALDQRGAADGVHHLGLLGRAGGLAAPLAARAHRLRRRSGEPESKLGSRSDRGSFRLSRRCPRSSRSSSSWWRVPFTTQPAPPDGAGMTPSLQNPYMFAYPPLLYLGYVGLTVPFAFAIGALLSESSTSGGLSRPVGGHCSPGRHSDRPASAATGHTSRSVGAGTPGIRSRTRP